jgi:hypothetical protein
VLKGAALFQPFAVDTRQSRKQVGLLVFDCVAFLVVRDGSVVLTVGERQHPIAFGHAVLIAPRTVFTYEPEGTRHPDDALGRRGLHARSALLAASDVFADRYVVRQYAGALFPDAAHVLHVNGEDATRLILVLDEMTTLYERREYPAFTFAGPGRPRIPARLISTATRRSLTTTPIPIVSSAWIRLDP